MFWTTQVVGYAGLQRPSQPDAQGLMSLHLQPIADQLHWQPQPAARASRYLRTKKSSPLAALISLINSVVRYIVMLPTLIRRSEPGVEETKPKKIFNYKLKAEWPPDFSKLSPQEKFRYEKRYKRRVHHLSVRPRWNKMVKLVQLGTITSSLLR
jgi:hypothetical protein